MAALTYRPCAVCSTRFPVRPQAPHAKFCSTKCRMQSHRQEVKASVPPQQNQMKSHEGNNEMKESQLFQPDAAHLKALQDIAVNLYRNAVQCNIDGMQVMGMTETFEVKTLQATLDLYVELLSQGYKPTDRVADMPKLIPHPVIDYVVLSLQKPDAQVEKEVTQIKAEVEADYLDKLAQAKAAAVAREVESKIRGARDKKLQAEHDARAAAEAAEYAAIEAEVLAALGGK